MKSQLLIIRKSWALIAGAAAFSTPLTGTTLRFTIEAKTGNSRLGSAIVGLGDLNGDGFPEVAVGDPSFTTPGTGVSSFSGSGQVLVVNGKTGSILYKLRGTPVTGQGFGTALAAIQANADKKLDIVVGAPGGSGAVWIYSGANGSLIRKITPPNPEVGSLFGFSIANAGDQNADGRDDLFVGAPGASTQDGNVAICSGSTGTVIMQIGVGVADSKFGSSVARAADQNGDGRPELVVGSPAFASNLGRLQIIASNNGFQLAEWLGAIAGARVGERVIQVDDRNGDSSLDYVVGSGSGGSAFLLSGTTLSLITDLSLAGAAANLPVVPGGSLDIDRDGDTELLVGYPGATPVARVDVIPAPGKGQPDGYDAAVPSSGLGLAIAVIPGLGFAIGEPLKGGGVVYIYSTLADRDRDGVPDMADRCKRSILTKTVKFGKLDTFVKNRVNADGCSLADLFAQLKPKTGWMNQRQFSTAAGKLVKKLRVNGSVSKKDANKLIAAAARAKVVTR